MPFEGVARVRDPYLDTIRDKFHWLNQALALVG
jgi:hypothetical protein